MVLIALSIFSNAQSDCKEPEYLNRIDGFDIASCQYSEYNEYEFMFNNLQDKYTQLKKGGVYYRINYARNESHTRNVSGDYIRQNYLNAVLKAKGENLSINKQAFKFRHNNKMIYMMIDNAWDDDDRGYQVYIIEETEMTQEIELTIKDALANDGKIALYGIFFDTDKSVIKPESESELSSLTAFLTENVKANVFIVGHTDNTGDFTHNLNLSKARAKAVADYLISKGIDAKRLSSEGVGPLCPVSTNATELGKKKNRRVEVVLR